MATNTLALRMSLTGIAQVEQGLRRLHTGLGAVHRVIALAPALTSALSAGAIIGFTKNAIDAADSMGKLAQKAGQATEQMSKWSYAASLADTEAEVLKVAMRDLSKHLQEQGKFGADLSEEMLSIADRMKNASTEAERLAIATSLPGKQWQNLIPLLSQGSEELRKQMVEAERFGKVISADFARDAQTFNDNITRLKAVGKGLWLQVANNILPTLIQLSERFIKLAADGSLVETSVLAITGAFAKLKDAGDLLAGFDQDRLEKLAAFLKVIHPQFAIAEEALKRLEQRGRLARLQAQLERGIATENKTDPGTLNFLTREATIKSQMAQAEARLKIISSSRTTTQLEQEIMINGVLKEQLKLVNEQIKALEDRYNAIPRATPATTDENGKEVISPEFAEFQSRVNPLLEKKAELEGRISDPQSVMEQTRQAMRALRVEFGTLAQQIARGFTNVIKSAVDAVATSIEGLITGTMTWGDALRNVATTILTSVINAISRMFAEWIIGRLAVKAVEIASAIAEGSAKLFPALMDSISSYGVAAAVGAAALAAALGAAGVFKEGGYTGNAGVNEPVGIVHGQEFVMPAEATNRIGIPTLQAMKDGAPMPASAAMKSDVNIYNVWSAAELRDRLFNSREGEDYMVSLISKAVNRIRR